MTRRRSSSTRRRTTRKTGKRTSQRSRSKSRRPSLPLPRISLTRDQWLDILGYGLLGIAAFTLLSFLTSQHGAITGPWVSMLRKTFGWGAYLTPLFVGAVGVWLVLREFGDRLPYPNVRQAIGIGWGYLLLLLTLHWGVSTLVFGRDMQAAAEAGQGGGYIGAFIGRWLLDGLGGGGMAVLLVTSWLIVIGLTFGLTLEDGLRLIQRLRGAWGKQGHLPPSEPPSSLPSQRPAPAAPPVAVADRGTRTTSPPTAPSPPAAPVLIGGDEARTWTFPSLDEVLEPGNGGDINMAILRHQAKLIEETLESLGAPVRVREINPGPVVTQFGIEPLVITHIRGKCRACNKNFGVDMAGFVAESDVFLCPHCGSKNTSVTDRREMRVKVGRIKSLADDLALALEARTLRIEAPIPGKGLVGVEVPNLGVSLVALRDVMESEVFRRMEAPLRLCLGQDVSGRPVVADLTAMPHLLIAGTTGSGKSVCINAIIASLLLQRTPDELKFLLVDPKRVELTGYEGIPHLLSKVVVEMERVTGALQWVLREMDGRYQRFSQMRATHIRDYNENIVPRVGGKKLPYIVVVIDELADLMMMAPQETERAICRIAQMARATGIHLVIATQRPSVDVVTGLIKANFPARIAFNVASSVDSRVILDMPGAEQLLGRGDMLFLPPDAPTPMRLQGAFVSDDELRRLVQFWKLQGRPPAVQVERSVQPPLWEEMQAEEEAAVEFEDELLPAVIDLVLREQRASISLLQRKLRIGYTRASRIMDILEEHQVVGPQPAGGKAREVFPKAARTLLEQARPPKTH